MNNDALVAALGMDAVAAVHGYRLRVISEAGRRGLRLISEALSDMGQLSSAVHVVIDPIDINLVFVDNSSRAGLAGRMLTWGPAHGWALSRPGDPPLSYYASPRACPLHLVPTASELLAWVTDELDGRQTGHSTPPRSLELDDDPAAILRLLSFTDLQRVPVPSQRGSGPNRHLPTVDHERLQQVYAIRHCGERSEI